ncbi:DUF2155 domain-containing protein [Alteriqipengyuania sp. WL0013]|uniref:DUF2155 domain-containing protein n=1 Tax=Alteriqipengyuania sp. WL0013 TaxID=3110773 RepID=UPI002C5E8C36|nr:DUF2155 domain-containing protein [Alteriqipengyuania sp. WL0013]MEB3415949.1 DUF2155 domain-containing protein [Alteriqipengyuania sp. WL0013]
MTGRSAACAAALLLLAACGSGEPDATPTEEATEVPEEFAQSEEPEAVEAAEGLGTPREERVATLGLLNKRNNVSREIEIKPGEAKRIGNVVVRLSTCEKSPPWEMPTQTAAFVQVAVQQRQDIGEDLEWQRVFSGWLFKESPSVNVVEHPIYDVWLKECAMSFPGEEADEPAAESNEA